MMDTMVATVIVNDGLTMKVGNCNCYARLASVQIGGEYKMQIDVNWTYQEFLVQDKTDNKVYINSDDCCDYKRSTTKRGAEAKFSGLVSFREGEGGHRCRAFPCPICPMSLEVVGSPYEMRRFMTDPAHRCKNIPCSYCGKDWPQFPPSDN